MSKQHKIIAIAAIGKNREIGRNGDIPWIHTGHGYRDDMLHFSKTTKGESADGHPCIMNSGTWKSLPEGYKPLPGRQNIVITSKSSDEFPLPEGVHRATSPEDAIRIAKGLPGSDETYLCGGPSLYQWAVENADELLLTEIPEEVPDADAFFPEFKSKGWVETERTISKNNQCEFVRYRRLNS